MAGKDFDSNCFKCIEEQQASGAQAAMSILKLKMQQNVANQDLDNIHVCARHS